MTLTQKQLSPCTSVEEYLGLFRDCFPETAGNSVSSPEHYRWKYGPGGKLAPPFEYAAYADDRIVGYYAGLPFDFHIGGRKRPAVLVCDVMTDSSMRGQGIFTRQGRYATDAMRDAGMSLCVGFPIRPEVFPGHLKVGWKIAFELPVYMKLLSLTPVLRPRGMGWLGAIARPPIMLFQAVCRATRRPTGGAEWRRMSVQEFLAGHDLAAFCARWAPQYHNCLLRSEEFLRWRLSSPSSEYSVVTVHRGGELVGLAVARISPLERFTVLSVLDLMVLDGHRAAVGALHDGLETLAREAAAAGVVVMCTRPDASRWMLYRNGYAISKVRFKLIVKWLEAGPEPESLLDAGAWHLGWLDTDVL